MSVMIWILANIIISPKPSDKFRTLGKLLMSPPIGQGIFINMWAPSLLNKNL